MAGTLRQRLLVAVGHDRYYRLARSVYGALSVFARGRGFDCNCCGRSYRRPWFPARLCPGCGSYPRHRLLLLYLERQVRLFERPLRVLHLAPEPWLQARARAAPNLRYLSVDLASPHAMLHLDITDLWCLPTNGFDLVICYHVLEHVPDDRAAMRELFRVLAPGGTALLQVPLRDAPHTEEDPELRDPIERERRFGQWDHVRWYGWDFGARLRAAGFRGEPRRWANTLPEETIRRHALDRDEVIWVMHGLAEDENQEGPGG